MTEVRAATDDASSSSAKAQYELGKKYEHGQEVKRDYQQAAFWYRQAAEQGHAEAQERLVFLFLNRWGVMTDGGAIDDDWMYQDLWGTSFNDEESSEQGIIKAQFNLGLAYLKGLLDMPQNYQQATFWFRKAAEDGLANAQYRLGTRYLRGEGVAQDYRQAIAWFRKAAEQGHAEAQFTLGSGYFMGEWVSKIIAKR